MKDASVRMVAMADLLRRYSSGLGFVPTRATSPEDLDRALALITPMRTEHDLVRVGAEGDGGYLIPDDLVGVSAVFSPGVADTWEFESDMQRRTGARIHMIEAAEVPIECPFDVDRGFLGPHTTSTEVGINDWIRKHVEAGTGDLVLQMDIEGGEYQVLQGIENELLARFRIIVIEFHRLDLLSVSAWCTQVFEPILSRLSDDFVVVHAHPNNVGRTITVGRAKVPELLEVTFLRRDRVEHIAGPAPLPHPLDADNTPAT